MRSLSVCNFHKHTHILYVDSLIVTHSHGHIVICPDSFYCAAICEKPGAVKMESSAFGKVGVENYPQWALNCQDPE